jgi:alkyl hydroperoxide reductase subunit F
VVPETVFPHGYAVLNADDDLVYKMKYDLKCNIALFSMDENNLRIKEHAAENGLSCVFENGYVTLMKGNWKIRVLDVKKIPLTYEGKAVLIASGAARKKLLVPGAEEFDNKGLTYCASCDGPLYADLDVAVVGGGNAGLETAIQLLAYCKSVTLIHRHAMLKGDAITVEKLSHNPKFKTICNAEPSEVHGDKFVTGLSVKDRTTGEVTKLDVEGVFVEIGVMPNTAFAQGFVELDAVGRVVTNPRDQKTSVEGVWAAGDCTDELYHQNNIAAGDAVKALEDIYQWIKSR